MQCYCKHRTTAGGYVLQQYSSDTAAMAGRRHAECGCLGGQGLQVVCFSSCTERVCSRVATTTDFRRTGQVTKQWCKFDNDRTEFEEPPGSITKDCSTSNLLIWLRHAPPLHHLSRYTRMGRQAGRQKERQTYRSLDRYILRLHGQEFE